MLVAILGAILAALSVWTLTTSKTVLSSMLGIPAGQTFGNTSAPPGR